MKTLLPWFRSVLLRKILFSLLVVSLVPLAFIANVSLQGYAAAKLEVVQQSKSDFDQKSFEGLRARSLSLAQRIASFLQEREKDLRLLASLPPSREGLLAFAKAKTGSIWTIGPDGKTMNLEFPVYRELAFVDPSGKEIIKVSNVCVSAPFSCQIEVSSKLANVSDPAQTLYKSETYFSEAIQLEQDQVYVGPPVGFYVPYERAYAEAQKRSGERYQGAVRFAMPVFDGGKKVGLVVGAVDMLHLIEFIAHVAPANPELQAEVDPREADFAYLIDPKGWAIAHPRHFNISGVDEQGQPVTAISEANRSDPNNLFRPGDLKQMGFMDPKFPKIVRDLQVGSATAGQTLTMTPFGGRERAMAVATIPYYAGRYNTPAGFGAVILSTDGGRFHLESDLLGKQIENRITELTTAMQWLAAITFAVGLLLAFLLARGVASPILRLTGVAHFIEKADWEKANIDGLTQTRGDDEISTLAKVFGSMAKEVRNRELELRKKVQQLQIVIDESKRKKEVQEITDSDFFKNLTQKAHMMREQRQQAKVAPAKLEEPLPPEGERPASAQEPAAEQKP